MLRFYRVLVRRTCAQSVLPRNRGLGTRQEWRNLWMTWTDRKEVLNCKGEVK